MTETPKRRKGPRTRVTWPAVILSGPNRMPCAILDVSRDGAKLQLPSDIPPQTYVIVISEKFGSLEGYVTWRNGQLAGIKFTDPGAAISLQPLLWAAASKTARGTPKFGRRRPT